jgi:ATP-dependent Clp protease ATP-binding subunit ClpA
VFERFTERARQVVTLAQEEARTLKHNYIGTEHILLGLLREEEGLASRALTQHGLTAANVRQQVLALVGASPDGDEITVQLPFTPRAKKVLEMSLREALSLGHNYIGTEHILLGLLREGDGIACRIIDSVPDRKEKLHVEIIEMLSGSPRQVHRAQRQRAGPSYPHLVVPIGGSTGRITCVRKYAETFEAAAAHAIRELPTDTIDVLIVNETTGACMRGKIDVRVKLT